MSQATGVAIFGIVLLLCLTAIAITAILHPKEKEEEDTTKVSIPPIYLQPETYEWKTVTTTELPMTDAEFDKYMKDVMKNVDKAVRIDTKQGRE